MENIIEKLISQLSENLSEIEQIKEDLGQIENQDNTFSSYPCVLINIPEIIWDNTSTSNQIGHFSVSISLNINTIDNENKLDPYHIMELIDKSLLGFQLNKNSTSLVRTKSEESNNTRGIKTYKNTYTFDYTEITEKIHQTFSIKK
ncbi:hypothetical protein N9251_00610 [Gammaproteobacteria bacterium]|nr:hypothetical protein [Gammaproteobacteria bacterium]